MDFLKFNAIFIVTKYENNNKNASLFYLLKVLWYMTFSLRHMNYSSKQRLINIKLLSAMFFS